MLAFCGAVQAASPVGSYITPTPGAAPPHAMFAVDTVAFSPPSSLLGLQCICSASSSLHSSKHQHVEMPAVCAGATAGYGDEVVFADGTFIDGSTAELSADGPLRPPYAVYCQGGTHWTHWALALEGALPALAAAHAHGD